MYRKMAAPSMSYSFAGKRVLVTGGGRGIGESIVRKFYNDGAMVFVIDQQQSLLDKLKNELPDIQTICADVLNWEATQEAVLAIAPLDHLINNAGIFDGGPIIKLTERQIDQVFGVNVRGLICVTQAFVNGNINNGSANETTIVNISSLADRFGLWGGAIYCASKAGVTSLTKTMALEFGELNIRVNCVSPSFLNTDLVRSIDPEILGNATGVMERTVLKNKALETTDIADSVLFLSSPLSSMITGTSLLIDAGTASH